jgi:ethanolamine ammonia-lyase small subunit
MSELPTVTDGGGEDAADDLWATLRRSTAARIGLARTGASLATGPLLDFRLAHARARDAVHAPLDEPKLLADLRSLGLPVVAVSSAVRDRAQYLLRPDLGRQLADADQALLAARGEPNDVVFVVTDGLSACAVQSHAQPLLAQVLPDLAHVGWQVAPLVLVRLGRVAIGDAVARALNADSVEVLIGERPGLSAPDSMGSLPDLAAGPADHRRATQLHFQHPAGGHRLRRRRVPADAPANGDAGAPDIRRRPQGYDRAAACGLKSRRCGRGELDDNFPGRRGRL